MAGGRKSRRWQSWSLVGYTAGMRFLMLVLSSGVLALSLAGCGDRDVCVRWAYDIDRECAQGLATEHARIDMEDNQKIEDVCNEAAKDCADRDAVKCWVVRAEPGDSVCTFNCGCELPPE